MRYEIVNCLQGDDTWREARRGIPTASRFKDVLAMGEGKMRGKYMRQLVGEIISGKPMKTYSNDRMEEGKTDEPEIRNRYSFDNNVTVELVGFVKMNPELCATGCSPDGLVDKDGMVEFKSLIPENLVEILDTGKMPTGHLPQVQGGLWIMNRAWCDLVFGCPDMPQQKIFRVTRDEQFIARLINEVKFFNIELKRLAEKIQRM